MPKNDVMMTQQTACLRNFVAAMAFILIGVPAGPLAAQSLDRQVESAVAQARLGSSRIGVCIIDAQSGLELAGVNPDDRLIPASNLKILTSGVALLTLGPEFEFRTEFIQHGSTLIIKGAGDPALADPELLKKMNMSADTLISRLAASITSSRTAPISQIIVDDRAFDRQYIHADWPKDQLNEWYCCEVSGLNFHANILNIFATPSSIAGESPRIRYEPAAPTIEVLSSAKTARRKAGAPATNQIGAHRAVDDNRYTVSGTLATSLEEPIKVASHRAGLLLAETLAAKLGGPTCRLAEPDEALGILETDPVLTAIRTPIAVALERCNVDSYNLYADCLLKAAGHAVTGQPGSWENGAAVVRAELRDRLDPEAVSRVFVADGSGMSRNNQVTARVLARWLGVMARESEAGPVFIESLATVGEGTLNSRFRAAKPKCEVRGKSGFINGVRTLSGYITHKETGRRLAYSILVNDTPSSVGGARVREFHEQVVLLADAWLIKQEKAKADGQAIGG